jgi:hypothetical protein
MEAMNAEIRITNVQAAAEAVKTGAALIAIIRIRALVGSQHRASCTR